MNQWWTEPDHKEWERHGLKCVVHRHPTLKHLCGYVRVPDGLDYDKHEAEGVPHGGVTYEDSLAPGVKEQEEEGYTWVGFDCAHYGDLSPGLYIGECGGVYRDIDYVTNEANLLADFING